MNITQLQKALTKAFKEGFEIVIIGQYVKIYNEESKLDSSFRIEENDQDFLDCLDKKEIGGFTFIKGLYDY